MNAFIEVTRAQKEMLLHPAHVKIWACGRRWGKSLLMAFALMLAASGFAGCTCWYVSPRYARSLKMMRLMKKSAGFMEMVSKTCSQFPPRFELINGSEICFISADREDELRGEGLRLICVDETSILTKHLFFDVLMPMTADSGGSMIAGSTYNGRNWFYDLAEEGKKDDPEIKTWTYPTSTGYAFVGSPEKVARLERLKKRTPPMVWQQEYECEPLAVVDAVFMYVDQCLTAAVPLASPERGHRYVCAQDIGRVVDASGIVVMDLDSGLVVHSETYPLGTLHSKQAERTRQIAAHWNNALIVLDTTGGASGGRAESNIRYYQEVLKSFMPITWTVDTKRNMVNQLALDFEQMRVKIPQTFKELISQLKLYRYKFGETAIQPTFYGRPDDLTAAMMMCAWAREKGWSSGKGNIGAFLG